MVSLRPLLAVVHCAAKGHERQYLWNEAPPLGRMATVWVAGQVTVRSSKSIVKSSLVKPPGTGVRSGIGLMTATWPAALSPARASPVPYAEHPQRLVLTCEQLQGDDGFVVVRAAGPAQRTVGDDPGIGLDRHMSLEPILATVHGLVGVAGVGIDGRDHPIRCDVLRDAPPSVGAVRALDRFDVLAGDQRQQGQRVSGLGTMFGLG